MVCLLSVRCSRWVISLLEIPRATGCEADGLQALAQISANVFLIPQRGNQQNDMLQNLMGSLFGGGGGAR